jgi:hypothetical protein
MPLPTLLRVKPAHAAQPQDIPKRPVLRPERNVLRRQLPQLVGGVGGSASSVAGSANFIAISTPHRRLSTRLGSSPASRATCNGRAAPLLRGLHPHPLRVHRLDGAIELPRQLLEASFAQLHAPLLAPNLHNPRNLLMRPWATARAPPTAPLIRPGRLAASKRPSWCPTGRRCSCCSCSCSCAANFAAVVAIKLGRAAQELLLGQLLLHLLVRVLQPREAHRVPCSTPRRGRLAPPACRGG